MRKYLLLLPLLVFGFILASCNSDDGNPADGGGTGTGGVFIQSVPTGAQIWVDGTNKNVTTPDSVLNISAGNHTVTLKLANYLDTTFTVNVVANKMTTPSPITLKSDMEVTTFGPIRIYETVGTDSTQPSGIDLSVGAAYGTTGSNKANVDIYYKTTSSGPYLVQTASSGVNTRTTWFKVSTASNLSDGTDSPAQSSTDWTSSVDDTETNYFFLFDADSHYSKMKITSMGGGLPGVPAWIEVTWIYNKKSSDTRF